MYRFTSLATDDPLWPELCLRDRGDKSCSDSAFQNLTKLFENNVALGILSDEMIQAQINQTALRVH